jgi:iron complex outermembrane receptor protein
MRLSKSAICILSVSCAFTFAAAARAQTAPADRTLVADRKADEDKRSFKLEEVIVQARRIEENIQTVPVAVTALSGAELEQRSVTSFQDLQFTEPSMTFSQSVNRNDNRITLRGQSTAYGSDFPGVDTLFADVPLALGGVTGGTAAFFDIQSVQVLKGPQGVAFGRNSTGGSVLIYPSRPGSTFEGYIDGRWGNFGHHEGEGMINIPIVADILMFRAAVHLDRQDGFTRNIITGTDLDDQHADDWRLSLLYEPADWLENYTILAGDTIRTHGSANHLIYFDPNGLLAQLYRPPLWNGPTFVAAATQALALGRDAIASNYDGYYHSRQLFLSNTTVAHPGAGLTLKNILGVQRIGAELGADMGGVPMPIIYLGQNSQPGPVNQTLSDELQLQGAQLNDQLHWVTGVFVSHQKPYSDGVLTSSISLGGLPISVNPTLQRNDQVVKSLAPYGQVTLPLGFVSDRLSTTLGARYTKDTRDARLYRETGGVCSYSDGSCIVDLHGKWTGWNWAATLNDQINESMLLYVAHRHGFKGGAFNPTAVDPALLLVKPEKVSDVELGLKTDWHLGSVQGRTNAAVYYQWYKDIVRSTFVFGNGVAYALNLNVADATIKGGEIETTIIPFKHLQLSFFYSYTDALYGGATDPTYLFTGSKHFPDVPLNKAGMTAEYSLSLPGTLGGLTASASANYQSRRAGDQNAISPFAYEGGYTLMNGRVDWRRVADKGLDVGVYVKNLTDKKYLLAGGDFSGSLGFIQALYGEPRTYGVEARYTFGN